MSSKINPVIPKLALRYGLVGGAFLTVVFLTFYLIDIKPGAFVTMIANLMVLTVFLFISLKDFKDNHNGGQFRFYHGMTIGVFSLVVMGTIFGLLYSIYIGLIDPNYLANKIEFLSIDLKSQIELEQDLERKEILATQLEGLSDTTFVMDILSETVKRIAFGYLLVPIFSIVFRTRQPQ